MNSRRGRRLARHAGGAPVFFMFQEGCERTVQVGVSRHCDPDAWRLMGALTRAPARQFAELLRAVAVFAVGGVAALAVWQG